MAILFFGRRALEEDLDGHAADDWECLLRLLRLLRLGRGRGRRGGGGGPAGDVFDHGGEVGPRHCDDDD